MERTKRGFYYLISFILTIILINILVFNVLALSPVPGGLIPGGFSGGIGNFIEQVGNSIGEILAPIIGSYDSSEFLFAKILLFFLLFAIIFVALSKIDLFAGNRAVHVTITLIVSILSVRYIKEGEFINAILLPYSALGIAISLFLPLLIYFYFVHFSGIGPFGRRTAWFIYGIVFLVLWGSRPYEDLGAANWVYLIGIGFILINLLFDKSIHQYLGLAGLARWRERAEDARISRLQAEYHEIRDVESVHAKRRKLQIMRELKRYNADRW